MNLTIEWKAVKLGEYINLLMLSRQNNTTRDEITKVLEHYGDFAGTWYIIFNVEEWSNLNPWQNLDKSLDKLLNNKKGHSMKIWNDIPKIFKMSRNHGAKKYDHKKYPSIRNSFQG